MLDCDHLYCAVQQSAAVGFGVWDGVGAPYNPEYFSQTLNANKL